MNIFIFVNFVFSSQAIPTIVPPGGDNLVVVIPAYERVTYEEVESLQKLKVFRKCALSVASGEIVCLISKADRGSFLHYMPRDLFAYSMDGGPFSTPSRKGSRTYVFEGPKTNNCRSLLPHRIRKFVAEFGNGGARLMSMAFTTQAFLQDCLPSTGYNVKICYAIRNRKPTERTFWLLPKDRIDSDVKESYMLGLKQPLIHIR